MGCNMIQLRSNEINVHCIQVMYSIGRPVYLKPVSGGLSELQVYRCYAIFMVLMSFHQVYMTSFMKFRDDGL